MEWKSVESSMIRSIAYNESEQQLAVEFQSGAIYFYSDVPESVYLEMMHASSKGSCFLETVKDQFDFRRIS